MRSLTVLVLALFLFAILGGPVIFYGLLAAGNTGLFDNAYDNFLVITGIGIAFIVIVWVAMLYIGNRAVDAVKNEEQRNG